MRLKSQASFIILAISGGTSSFRSAYSISKRSYFDRSILCLRIYASSLSGTDFSIFERRKDASFSVKPISKWLRQSVSFISGRSKKRTDSPRPASLSSLSPLLLSSSSTTSGYSLFSLILKRRMSLLPSFSMRIKLSMLEELLAGVAVT